MQIKTQIEPCKGKAGDLVTLKVQFAHMGEEIKSAYARTGQGCWQLNKEKEN